MKKFLLVALPLLMLSCSSNDDSTVIPVIPVQPEGVAYFRGNINGVPTDYTYNYTNGISYGYYNGTSGVGNDSFYSYAGTIGASNFVPNISIGWDNMYTGGTDQEESTSFYDTFSVIPQNFITEEQYYNHVKGVNIGIEEGNDKFYGTQAGSQAGSSFVVLSSTQGTEYGGSLKTKTVVGTFNCKLYNFDDPSDIKTITNGSFKIIVRESY